MEGIVSFLKTPKTEIESRISTLRHAMSSAGMDAVFLTHKPDIFYFSGTAQECYLMVYQDSDPVLYVKHFLPRALAETSIFRVKKIESVKEIFKNAAKDAGTRIKNCGLAFDVVPHRDFLFYESLFENTVFKDAAMLINACRQIKSDWEIARMEQAADLSKKTFDYMARAIEPGISEMEFCGMFETFARKYGHSGKLQVRHYRAEGFAFHLMSGRNGGLPGALDSPVCGTGTSCAYPYGAGPKQLAENEPILIDFGTVLNGYHMDESRMFVIGKMERAAMDACKASIDILYALVEMMKPGQAMAEVYDTAVAKAGRMGYESTFLGIPEQKAAFIGHGVGLELVEAPVVARKKQDVLLPGMVLAIEPKFIFKDRFAAGIESVVHITEKGARLLSVTDHKVFEC